MLKRKGQLFLPIWFYRLINENSLGFKGFHEVSISCEDPIRDEVARSLWTQPKDLVFGQMHKGVNLHPALRASACPVEGEASSSGVGGNTIVLGW